MFENEDETPLWTRFHVQLSLQFINIHVSIEKGHRTEYDALMK